MSDSLSVDVGIEGEGWGAKFSASVAYQEVKAGMTKNNLIYFESLAKCIYYEATARKTAKLAPDFIQDVKDLPLLAEGNTLKEYVDFIKTYGTHYVSQVIMGSKAMQKHIFKKTEFKKLTVISLFSIN